MPDIKYFEGWTKINNKEIGLINHQKTIIDEIQYQSEYTTD